MKQDS